MYMYTVYKYNILLTIALAIFCRSPAAYEALKSFKILQLPALQAYTGAFLHEPGANSASIEDHSSFCTVIRD